MTKLRSTLLAWYRPYLNANGRSVVFVNGHVQDAKVLAILTEQQWQELDGTVMVAFAERAPTVQRFRSEKRIVTLVNGLDHAVVPYHQKTGTSAFSIVNIPLPITYADTSFDVRCLQTSNRNGTPLDETGVIVATRRVAEAVEASIHAWDGKLLIGLNPVLIDTGDTFRVMTVMVPVPSDFELQASLPHRSLTRKGHPN